MDNNSDSIEEAKVYWTRQKCLQLTLAIMVAMVLMGGSVWVYFKAKESIGQYYLDGEALFFNSPFELQHQMSTTPQVTVGGGDRRPDKNKLRIVNFNAEWLFYYGGSGQVKCPGNDCPWKDEEMARNHFHDVAQVLIKTNADIIHLTEVESYQALELLLSILPIGHGYKPYFLNSYDYTLGQSLGILSRVDLPQNLTHIYGEVSYPITGGKCPVNSTGKIRVAKNYVARFNLLNGSGNQTFLCLVGLHLLAQPKDDSRCAPREGQAEIIRDYLVNSLDPREKLVILGDLNDLDHSIAVSYGTIPISSTLEILKSVKPGGLRNALALIPQQSRFTYSGFIKPRGIEERMALDHVLVDPSLKLTKVGIGHDIVKNPLNSRVSDHRPVLIEIDLK